MSDDEKINDLSEEIVCLRERILRYEHELQHLKNTKFVIAEIMQGNYLLPILSTHDTPQGLAVNVGFR